MTLDPEFWRDRFHLCALYAGKLAHAQGKLEDSEYVRRLTYRLYEEGAFRDMKSEAERGCS
jgi:hypothetical protein